MSVNSVSSISFSARNPLKKANKELSSRTSSQVNTNDTFKKVENGKHKSTASKVFWAGVAGLVGSKLLVKGAANRSIALDKAGKLTDKAAKSLAKTMKVGFVISGLAPVALLSSAIISVVNKAKASKTANN